METRAYIISEDEIFQYIKAITQGENDKLMRYVHKAISSADEKYCYSNLVILESFSNVYCRTNLFVPAFKALEEMKPYYHLDTSYATFPTTILLPYCFVGGIYGGLKGFVKGLQNQCKGKNLNGAEKQEVLKLCTLARSRCSFFGVTEEKKTQQSSWQKCIDAFPAFRI